MKTANYFQISVALVAGTCSVLSAENILITCWEWSNMTGADTENHFSANVSDQLPGDGEAIDGVTGTLYANGEYGSDTIDNSAAFTFAAFTPSSAFNNDIPLDTRPASDDLGGDGIDNAPARLSISDGTFGAGGDADPSNKFIVFAVRAIDGQQFGGPVQFTSAIGTTTTSMQVEFSYSYDGSNYTPLDSFTTTSLDEQGPDFFFEDAAGNSELFLRLKVPTLGFEALYLDNLQFIGELGPGGDNESFWAKAPLQGIWRNTGEAFAGEPGMGWIHDASWPYIYTFSMGNAAEGEWVYIYTEFGDRTNFWGYSYKGFYFLGSGATGWYYSYETGDEGYKSFNR